MERATVRVEGVVQSVGFRPFVYRTATDLGLRGTVRNRGDAGVLVELEGPSEDVAAFLRRLREENPPLASVESVGVEREAVDDRAFESFEIVESAGSEGGGGTIPPDTAMCEACRDDMRDGDSRYHDYWATACVDCGPRFTVVEALPYDRPTTSMAAFPMCDDCRAEYERPTDRRYHAQAIACPQCGPTLQYCSDAADAAPAPGEGDDGRDPFPAGPTTAAGRDAVAAAADTLREGGVVVAKGVGGAHLVCDATADAAVARLRERTGRPEKPFAVMAPDLDAVETFAQLAPSERETLAAPRRPILLLERREGAAVTTGVAPGLHTVGVMLPYSGVHHLLFDEVDAPLVMTSANMPGRPMLVENGAIVDGLADVADGVLLHDRRIVARCDDSVARVVDGERRLVRRSRGFVPVPVAAPGATASVLALGPELDVAAAVLDDEDCYLTQYVGDVDDVATAEYLTDAVAHLLSITGLDRPPVVAHDRHPDFLTSDRARQLEREAGVDRVPVQHHHAHAASVLGEHGREAAIAITVDGVGYGPDGTVWGGEVLDATRADYERVGGLSPMDMPGGDRATRYPGRMLAGGLARGRSTEAVRGVLDRRDVWLPGGDEELGILAQQLESGVNTPTTTSAGRFLDAVSALVGACHERTYEGEPAMKLEAVAARGRPRDLEPPFRHVDGRRTLDAPALLDRLVELVAGGVPRADVAATAQAVLARGLADIAVAAADDRGREAVALSGGVAYNDHIASVVADRVHEAGLDVLGNEAVPPGDGGVGYGQAIVAAARTG